VPLSERLGQEGLRLQKLARGIGLRSLVRAEPALHFEEAMELEYPVMELEPLLFILSRLLDQLCLRLAARVLATQELRLRLELERSVDSQQSTVNSLYEMALRLPVPMRDSKVFLKLLHLRLKSDPPPAPILKARIAAQPAKPRVAQHGLFLPLSPDPEKLEVTLARIAGLVGKENIGSPQLVDTHRLGAFRMNPFNPLDCKGGSRTTPTTLAGWSCPPAGAQGAHLAQVPTMARRVFRPPRSATVELRAGRPARVFASGARGEVLWAAGPWRTSGDWWREDAWEHDEWDILLAKLIRSERMSVVPYQSSVAKDNGLRTTDCGQAIALYRIYRDLASGSWFVLGSYD
jgi:protein ImuB